MEICYNGHASFTFRSNKFSITVDPWINTAFLGSWHPFPDNHSCIDAILRSDAILMSHEHEDHCDIELLKSYKGRIYIPKYRSDSFCRKLGDNGIDFTEVEPRHKHCLGEFNIEFVIQSAPAWEDAAIIISKGNMTFIDMNDLKPGVEDIEYIKTNYPNPTFYAYQYSGASWHPMTYIHLSDEEKKEISHTKILRKFKNASILIHEFNPSFILPSAGPPSFLFDEHLKFNNGITAIFPNQEDYEQFLSHEHITATPLYLRPANHIEYQNGKVICSKELYSTNNFPDRTKEILELKHKKKIASFLNGPGTDGKILSREAISKYFNKVFSNTAPFKNLLRYLIHYEIIGEDGEKLSVFVNYRKASLSFDDYDRSIPIGFKFRLHTTPFSKLMNWEISWEELFLSLQFDMEQYFPHYDENAIILHKFCHTQYLQKYFQYYRDSFKNETFTLEYNNEKYEVQRFCPHAMGDLSKGEIVDGKIICSNHGWAFCLKDGSSTDTELCIQVKKVNAKVSVL